MESRWLLENIILGTGLLVFFAIITGGVRQLIEIIRLQPVVMIIGVFSGMFLLYMLGMTKAGREFNSVFRDSSPLSAVVLLVILAGISYLVLNVFNISRDTVLVVGIGSSISISICSAGLYLR